MITPEVFFGLSVEAAVGGGGTYNVLPVARVHIVTPSGAGANATLPDARDGRFRPGRPSFVIWNASGSQSLDLKNFNGSTLMTLTPNQLVITCLIADTISAGVWARMILNLKT